MQAAAIWAEPPNLSFPPYFVKLLDLEEIYSYISERIETVRDRINKRNEEETKKRQE